MTTAARIAQRIDDGVNPIVVKELRQAIGGKFLPAVLLLFLLVQLFWIGIAAWVYRLENDLLAGREVFVVLLGILMSTCLLFLPAYAGLRLSAERSDTNVDLLFITTIRPRTIVWGKFLASMVLAIMLFSACTPFLALTYLLRGIDLPTIFLLLAINFFTVAACVMFAIFIACIPAKRGTRFILGLGTLGAMAWTLGGIILISDQLSRFGFLTMGVSRWEFWTAMGSMLAMVLLGMGLAVVLSVAMISPPSSNRALYVRLYLLFLWLATGAVAWGWAWHSRQHEVISIWVMGSLMFLGMVFLAAISERNDWGPRVRRAVPRNPLLRALAFLFFSGSAGGVAWTLLMGGATLGIAYGWHEAEVLFNGWGSAFNGREFLMNTLDAFGALTLYTIAYLLTALWLRRRVLHWMVIPVNTYALALILMALGSILPFIIGLLVMQQQRGPDFLENKWWTFTVPFFVLDYRDNTERWLFAGTWAVAMGIFTLPWLFLKWREFCAIQPPVKAAAAPPLPQPVLVTTEAQPHE